ncbi:MAG: YopX family protein [Nanoarchaeota archaeon]
MAQREIKFRAWDDCEKKMVVPTEEELGYWLDNQNKGIKEFYMVLMQFTGLLDKNGKEIYEGDILERDIHGRGVVKWNEVGWVCYAKKDEQNYGNLIGATFLSGVIGNVYENSELVGKN